MSKHKISQGRFLPATMLALLVTALSLSLLACGGGGSGQEGTLRVAIERIGLPQFTPSTVTWPNESNRWGYGATETLLGSDADGKSINRLAKSWEVRDDGIHITLQEGVEFHKDQGEFTSADVLFNYAESMKDGSRFVDRPSLITMFEPWQAVDKYTVFVPWKDRPSYWWMKHNSPAWPGVVNMWSKKYIEETGQDNVSIDVGTGPFEMIEFRAEDRVELEAVSDHWRQTADWEGLEILEVREAATRVAMMKAGEVDIADIPLPNLPQVEDVGTFRPMVSGTIFEIHLAGQFYILNNPVTGEMETNIYTQDGNYKNEQWLEEHPWIGNIEDPASMEQARKVRRAMAMAIDKESIVRNVLLERGAPIYATRNNTSSEHLAPGTHDRWAGELSYDPEGAKALLAEAGYPNGFKTDFFNVSGARPLQQEIGTAVIPMLRAVGIDINEQRVEWSSIAGKSSKGEVAAPLMIGGSREIWPITFRAGPPLGYGGFGWSHQRVLDDRDVMLFSPSVEAMSQVGREHAEFLFEQQFTVPVVEAHRVFVAGPNIGDWWLMAGPGGHINNFEYVQHAEDNGN